MSKPTKAELIEALKGAAIGLRAVCDHGGVARGGWRWHFRRRKVSFWDYDYGCGCMMLAGSVYGDTKRILKRAGHQV